MYEIFLIAVSAISGAGGLKLLEAGIHAFANRKKTGAEANSISAASQMSTVQISDRLVREWMETADKATKEVILGRRHMLGALNLIEEMLFSMEKAGCADISEFQERLESLKKAMGPDI